MRGIWGKWNVLALGNALVDLSVKVMLSLNEKQYHREISGFVWFLQMTQVYSVSLMMPAGKRTYPNKFGPSASLSWTEKEESKIKPLTGGF